MRPALLSRLSPLRVMLLWAICALSTVGASAQAVSISSQPANAAVCPGADASFSLTALNAVTYMAGQYGFGLYKSYEY